MKTEETSIPQMDDIVFEKRNKMYGAYILRKMYNKQLNKALLLAVAILAAGLAYPLVSSYNSKDRIRISGDTVAIDLLKLPKHEPEAKPVIPDAPKAKPETRVRFVAPDVTFEEVIDEGGLPSMDDINLASGIIPLYTQEVTSIEKPVEVIEDPEKAPPVLIVEEMPEYPGGDMERLRFLASNIQYPMQATENGIQGTVYFQFIIDSKGNITDVKILRGIGGGCDEEALRVIKMMPQWKPGRQNGRTVRVLYTMPVSFRLQV
jgi:periplasmic protein TonB